LSLEAARDDHIDTLRRLRDGINPMAARKRKLLVDMKAAENTFKALYCKHIGESGEKLFQAADQLGLEGGDRKES
jgi:hypothetical protein